MPDQNDPRITTKADGIPAFPHRRAYLLVVGLLIIISVFELQFVHVTSVTLILFLLAWLPFLIPWLYTIAPQIGALPRWLRDQGIEEIGTTFGNIKIRLNAAAKEYQETVLQPIGNELPTGPIEKQLDQGYQEAIKLAKETQPISAQDALKQVDELAGLYDQVRNKRDLGTERVQLMKDISAAMWSLMQYIEVFPVTKRLLSDNGGTRLSAYKYLEWRPSAEFLDLLLSRSVCWKGRLVNMLRCLPCAVWSHNRI